MKPGEAARAGALLLRHGLLQVLVFPLLCCLCLPACSFYAEPPPLVLVEDDASPIVKAIQYLGATQVTPEEEASIGGDFAGNWPQYISPESLPSIRVRDISPFMATFVHHSLTLITERNQAALELDATDIERSRLMRIAAVGLMHRFEAPSDDPAAGTFGFWPAMQHSDSVSRSAFAQFTRLLLVGPTLMGSRSPVNIAFFPPDFALPTDADDTATIYAALLDHAMLDGGSPITVPVHRFFSDWRDLGRIPRRNNPGWLTPSTGAFFTWLDYRSSPGEHMPNDIDVIVNANVLYTLARYDRLDTPGAREAIDLINTTTAGGHHATDLDEVTLYYPDNLACHYCIARAFAEGPVPQLKDAVDQLADELEGTWQLDRGGNVHWDRDDPHLNTAFAVLTLLNAGRASHLTDSAVKYLISNQNPVYGNWDESAFFCGNSDSDRTVLWSSPAITTAIAMESLARHRLTLLAFQ